MTLFSQTIDELNNLYEAWMSRDECIAKIKATGKKYDFEKYSDAQLFRMWERIEAEETDKADEQARIDALATSVIPRPKCEYCHNELNDAGECPECDLGDRLD